MNERGKINDKRCRKTRKAIRTAVAQLMTEKDVSSITITEISELADINRKTFYAHYSNVNDVLDDIEDELVGTLSELLENITLGPDGFDPMPIFKQLTDMLEEDPFYGYLLEATYSGGFFAKVGVVMEDMVIDALRPYTDLDKDVISEAVNFTAAGFLSAYRGWIRSGKVRPLESVAQTALDLAKNGIFGLLGIQSSDSAAQ